MEDSKLIELVRGHPSVFNPKHHLYKDANVRDNVWKEIAVRMNISADECKIRWKNILDTFMRRKRAKKLPTGSESSKKVRKWHLEKYLDFLNMVDCERERVTNTITQEEMQISDDRSESLNEEEPFDSGYPDPENLDFEKRLPAEILLSGDNILKMFNSNSKERYKMMATLIEQQKEKHPIDVFFTSMAMTVKQFSRENQIRARMEVCEIVSQLEMDELNQTKIVMSNYDNCNDLSSS